MVYLYLCVFSVLHRDEAVRESTSPVVPSLNPSHVGYDQPPTKPPSIGIINAPRNSSQYHNDIKQPESTTPGIDNFVNGISNPTHGISNSGTGISNPGTGISNPAPGISNPTSGISNPGTGIRNTASGISNPDVELINLEAGTEEDRSPLYDI